MNKFWAEMIIKGKAKLSDIKDETRKAAVIQILEQYRDEGKIDQSDFEFYMNPVNED